MATPPLASDAQAATIAARIILQAQADGQFLSQAAQAITNAEDQGVYFVVLTTFENCNIRTLQAYLQSLGYVISYPEFQNPNLSPWNPAQLFGWAWDNYWNNNEVVDQPIRNPARMKMSWKKATPVPSPMQYYQFVPEYRSIIYEENILFPVSTGG